MRKLIFAAAALASVIAMSAPAYAEYKTWQCKYVSINGRAVWMCGY